MLRIVTLFATLFLDSIPTMSEICFMQVIIIESEAYQKLLETIEEKINLGVKKALEEKREKENSDWIDLKEAKLLLPFKSKSSWQKLRDQGKIEFSQFGRKIMYSKKSILTFLSEYKVGIWKQK